MSNADTKIDRQYGVRYPDGKTVWSDDRTESARVSFQSQTYYVHPDDRNKDLHRRNAQTFDDLRRNYEKALTDLGSRNPERPVMVYRDIITIILEPVFEPTPDQVDLINEKF